LGVEKVQQDMDVGVARMKGEKAVHQLGHPDRGRDDPKPS
jgi:hypothetical protein